MKVLKDLVRRTPSRIVLLVCDGLGGLPHAETGRTELETARTPTLDALAARSDLGLAEVVAPGVTPGCLPGHLALLGYNPLAGPAGQGVGAVSELPPFGERYELTAAAVATHSLIQHLAGRLGMAVLPTGEGLEAPVQAVRAHWAAFDFFFVHVQETETAGLAGDFQGKVRAIEDVDACLPELLALRPDVFALTGDHATPSVLGRHSWHPVPFLLHSPWVIPMAGAQFTERTAGQGILGHCSLSHTMPLLLAHALKLLRYGP